MKRETLALVGFIFLISIENLLVKIILPVISPVTLYGLRVAILSILFFLFLRPKVKGVRRNQYLEMFIIGSFTAIEYIFHYYAIGYIGIVQTALISLLGPVLILFFSKFFLKEKLTLKKALADAIIILCVAAVYLIH
jgi:drug/metabolite transporter (DMT)-like permease